MLRLGSQFQALDEVGSLKRQGEASASSYGATLKMISWNMFKARRKGCMPDLASMSAGVELALLQEAVLHGGLAQPFHLASGPEWIMAEIWERRDGRSPPGPRPAVSSANLRDTWVWGLQLFPESLVRRFSIEGAVRSVEVVEVLPLVEFGTEIEAIFVGQELVKLFLIRAM